MRQRARWDVNVHFITLIEYLPTKHAVHANMKGIYKQVDKEADQKF